MDNNTNVNIIDMRKRLREALEKARNNKTSNIIISNNINNEKLANIIERIRSRTTEVGTNVNNNKVNLNINANKITNNEKLTNIIELIRSRVAEVGANTKINNNIVEEESVKSITEVDTNIVNNV